MQQLKVTRNGDHMLWEMPGKGFCGCKPGDDVAALVKELERDYDYGPYTVEVTQHMTSELKQTLAEFAEVIVDFGLNSPITWTWFWKRQSDAPFVAAVFAGEELPQLIRQVRAKRATHSAP